MFLPATVTASVLIFLTFHLKSIHCATCTGCVELDELNFDKTILRFPYALIKFDIAFPYGEKHEAFAAFSQVAHKLTDDLLIGTVGIKDYGENENKALGDRFNLDEKKFPGIFLFTGSSDKFIKLPDHLDVTLDNLKGFVTQHTELYIGRDGCLKDFNELAKGYANLSKAEKLQQISKTQKAAEKLEKQRDKLSAQMYLTFMEKINEKGYDFVEAETKRLLRLKAGKVTDAKKTELKQKLNVLESFRVNKLKNVENEEL